ncbi:histidine phosphatase family protein [Prosthecomicrobium sp. N25]|uniref:histidine phosphatase family protein n=1 Tax=Prosthecomicrobium sp. N25 TaxID=3129254 RepID=UPI00307801A0
MADRHFVHIRHGQTDWNAAGRLQGSQDIPLNDLGRSQAARNGRTLAAHLVEIGRAPGDYRYVASPLGRARATMEIVRAELGLDPAGYETDPRLSEVSFGSYEGYTYDDIAAEAPETYRSLRADKWHFLPPGGESYAMLRVRVGRFFESLDGDVVVVSHGGVYRALKSLLLAVQDPALAEAFVPQDRISVWRNGAETWM